MTDDEFRALADLLPDGLLLVDGAGVIRAGNGTAAHLLGEAKASLAGRSLAEFAASEQAVVELLRVGARSKSLIPSALVVRRSDGATETLRCESGLLKSQVDAGERLILLRLQTRSAAVSRFVALNERIDALAREVARRRVAESELFAYAERLRVTLTSIGDALIATDAHGVVTLMNEVAQSLTGWTEAEALGRSVEEVFVIVNQPTRRPVESPVAKVLRDGKVVGLANHTVLIARDGTERPIDDSGAPIRGENGQLLGVVLVFRDITERYAAEALLSSKSEQLAQADRRKDEFLSMLAHELRNPLAPMTTGVHLLISARLEPAKQLQVAQMLQRQIRHMTRLVDDLLDVARVTQGKMELKKAIVPLQGVIREAVDMSRQWFQSKDQQFDVGLIPEGAMVEADSVRLVQVFTNLLSNATRFTPRRGHISLRCRVDGRHATVSVKDNGVGIDTSVLPQVFGLFVQAERSLDRSEGGLGIGLNVVQALVELHGGSVAAYSAGLGHGAEFNVRLPLHLEPASHIASDRGTSAAAGVKRRVLVVDDNEDAAESLHVVLSLWGHDARSVSRAQAALDLWPEFKPQVALLDIGLPEMTGYELATLLRALPGGQEASLIAITGYGQAADREKSREAGMDAHLTKPVDLDHLKSLLEQLPRPL